MTAQTFTLLAEKGGVGRTTLCINLAGTFARQGCNVLLVDMEGQASVSKLFFGPHAVDQLPIDRQVACLFDDNFAPNPSRIIHPTKWKNISVAPASRLLADYDYPRPATLGPIAFSLRDFFLDIESLFDVIIVDTPPKIQGLLAYSALLASHYVITPVEPEAFAIQSVVEVQRLIMTAQQNGNSSLQHLGYVVTLKSRSSLHNANEKALRNTYQSQVFQGVVSRNVACAEANSHQMPVTEYNPKTKSTQAAVTRSVIEHQELAADITLRISGQSIPARTTTKKARRVA